MPNATQCRDDWARRRATPRSLSLTRTCTHRRGLSTSNGIIHELCTRVVCSGVARRRVVRCLCIVSVGVDRGDEEVRRTSEEIAAHAACHLCRRTVFKRGCRLASKLLSVSLHQLPVLVRDAAGLCIMGWCRRVGRSVRCRVCCGRRTRVVRGLLDLGLQIGIEL